MWLLLGAAYVVGFVVTFIVSAYLDERAPRWWEPMPFPACALWPVMIPSLVIVLVFVNIAALYHTLHARARKRFRRD